MSSKFARRYPKIAGRLQLEGDLCEVPHTERLIESFALLAARIHKKQDGECPEIAGSFLDVLYPYYQRPTIAKRYRIDRGRQCIPSRCRRKGKGKRKGTDLFWLCSRLFA
ncbi:type VI secretion system baseplate subunit TssF [Crenobacter sp. SG2303]|uniref:Type VI secretion system baseplate subunit TssF n=1 Tax=Crenobacter oryzisoli TaxID=3056844 RepID=A0ABT7XL44_9NEIS|nr:type VI secretion system baseplate subunit TssF [Crenobacter sp. SG2303]MDN0074504.1 type VI secretion system baseplate subunit TssF [Crenobacter sp. SG2303]